MRNWEKPKAYAVKNRDESIRRNSRSGGVFTALSDVVLSYGGAVYGCILTDDFKAVHVRALAFDTRNKMRGSKYVQSTMGDIFKSVKQDLDSEIKVLFSGTSCQIDGLRGYLGKPYENLICVDVVCHGVPSPKVWNNFLQWQEDKQGALITSVDFRNKVEYGWAAHVETLDFANGHHVSSEVFKTIFYGNKSLRPCCYNCPYRSITHPGDITIADYWGIDKAAPGFNDNKGVSLVMVNNETGENIFESAADRLIFKNTKIEDSMQPPLEAPYKCPEDRDKFWRAITTKSFEFVAKKYGGYGVISKLKRKIKSKGKE